MQNPLEKPVFGAAVIKYPWLILADALQLAVSVQCMAIAFVGLTLMTLSWQLSGSLFGALEGNDEVSQAEQRLSASDTYVTESIRFHQRVATWPSERRVPDGVGYWAARAMAKHGSQWQTESQANSQTGSEFLASVPIDPVVGVAYRIVEPFRRLFQARSTSRTLVYYLFGGCLALSIWALCGGAITRTSVVRHARGRQISLQDSLQFAAKRWRHLVSAPAIPLIGMAMLGLPFALLGWLMRSDLGIAFAGLLWLPVLVGGVLMAILGLGLLLGWPLMWGSVCTERSSDGFDAISRAYAYTFQRPLHYLFYALMAAVLGLVGWVAMWAFSEAIVQLSFWSVSLGCGQARLAELQQVMTSAAHESGELSSTLWFGGQLFRILTGAVRMLASAYSFSYFWCVAGSWYLLLRRDTDGQDIDDVMGEDGLEAAATAANAPAM